MEAVPDETVSEGDLAIAADVMRTAMRVIDGARVKDLLETWAREDHARRRSAGPTPWASETQVLTLMVAVSLMRNAPLVTRLRDAVKGTDAKTLALLGLARPEGLSGAALYHRLYNSHTRLRKLYNPEPWSHYRLMTREEFRCVQDSVDPRHVAQMKARGHQFINAVLHGTYLLIPRATRRKLERTRVDVAVDATAVASPGRGRSRKSPFVSADPGAAWYIRQGNHGGSSARIVEKYGRTQDDIKWARELTTLVSYGQDGPKLVLAAALDKPGKNLADNAWIVTNAFLGYGFIPGHWVADRAYVPHLKMEDMALPLRAKAFTPVFDYDKDKFGVQGNVQGAPLVDGQLYSPGMPLPLVTASYDYWVREKGDSQRIDRDTFEKRVKRREAFALRLKQSMDDQGYARFECPAVGKYADVACALREPHPESTARPKSRTLLPMTVKATPPKVCVQKSITVAADEATKLWQEYPYWSPEWRDHYTRGRQTVESLNASVKRSYFSPIHERGNRPARGWAAQLLSLAVMVAATNVRKVKEWEREHVDPATGQVRETPRKPQPPRRRDVLAQVARGPNAPPDARRLAA